MLELPLTHAQNVALLATLRSSHRIRVGVDILNRSEKVQAALEVPASRVLAGEVLVDATADITRTLSLDFLDEKRELGFDPTSPAQGALFADNLVAVRYGVLVAGAWVEIPCFWGPVTKFTRDGARVTIEALGKESYGLAPHFATQGYTLRKGRRCDTAVRDVMDRIGETRYNLPEMPARLPRPRAVQPDDEPWRVVKFGWESVRRVMRGKGDDRHRERVSVEYNGLVSLAGNFYAFYNGRGQLTARRRTTTPVFTFREGRDLVSLPVPTFDVLAGRNHVVVTGARVTRGKKPNRRQVQMRGTATLPATHPFSPAALARNGKRRFLTEFVTVENLKTKRACEDRAKRILDEKARDGLNLAFNSLPFPMLEELDTVRVQTDAYDLDIRLQRFSIPLTADGVCAVGWER